MELLLEQIKESSHITVEIEDSDEIWVYITVAGRRKYIL